MLPIVIRTCEKIVDFNDTIIIINREKVNQRTYDLRKS